MPKATKNTTKTTATATAAEKKVEIDTKCQPNDLQTGWPTNRPITSATRKILPTQKLYMRDICINNKVCTTTKRSIYLEPLRLTKAEKYSYLTWINTYIVLCVFIWLCSKMGNNIARKKPNGYCWHHSCHRLADIDDNAMLVATRRPLVSQVSSIQPPLVPSIILTCLALLG